MIFILDKIRHSLTSFLGNCFLRNVVIEPHHIDLGMLCNPAILLFDQTGMHQFLESLADFLSGTLQGVHGFVPRKVDKCSAVLVCKTICILQGKIAAIQQKAVQDFCCQREFFLKPSGLKQHQRQFHVLHDFCFCWCILFCDVFQCHCSFLTFLYRSDQAHYSTLMCLYFNISSLQ